MRGELRDRDRERKRETETETDRDRDRGIHERWADAAGFIKQREDAAEAEREEETPKIESDIFGEYLNLILLGISYYSKRKTKCASGASMEVY